MQVLHSFLFWASFWMIPQVWFRVLISPSTVQCLVFFGLPLLHLPSGIQCRAVREGWGWCYQILSCWDQIIWDGWLEYQGGILVVNLTLHNAPSSSPVYTRLGQTSPPPNLFMNPLRNPRNKSRPQLVGSVGRAPNYQVGGLRFEPLARPTLRVLK